MCWPSEILSVKRKSKARRKRGRKKWLFALVAVLLFFAIVEAALLIAGFRWEPFMEDPDWWKRFKGQPIYQADPYLFWRLKPLANTELDPDNPATHRINSMGFRSEEFNPAKEPNELRIITMGDSCTFGDGVANWETFTKVLLDRLVAQNPGRKITAINAGVPGYTSYQVLTYLEQELLKLQPDLVTVYVGFNDNIPAHDEIPDANRAPSNLTLYTTLSFIRKLRTVQFVGSLVAKYIRPIKQAVPSEKEGHSTFRVPFKDYVANLCRIKELGDKNGFKVIIMTLPHVPFDESERNPYIRKASGSCSIPMIDLWFAMKTLQLKDVNLFEPDGGHPNTLGHKYIAQFIHRKMGEMGMVPAPAFEADLPSDEPFEIPRPPEEDAESGGPAPVF